MIIIISKEADHSTNRVIKWLIRHNKDYLRLGEQQFINALTFEINNSAIEINLTVGGREIEFRDITAFWYRKHFMELLLNIPLNFNAKDKVNNVPNLNEYLLDEIESVRQFLFYRLEQKNHIGNFKVGNGNKLISFSIAIDVGLEVPSTYISTNLILLKQFSKDKRLIAKPVEDAFSSIYNHIGIKSNYLIAEPDIFLDKEDNLFPSCLQEYIEKKLELRVFYLKGRITTMAIFSQNDERTKIDFRNYNEEKPNRMLPFNLPKEIESKIVLFMNSMQLQSGSLDFILSIENKYVFLEVNPVGQYGMVSQGCNVDLSKDFAKELMKI